ncbi:hypothetical protein [Flavobacterium sp.]|uniref:hypothetical protein n=1 Tax=Flavobacterium sp. TaxID=239 RepID=UPI00378B902F
MAKIKKIAIITTHSFGYIDFVVNRLNTTEGVDLTYINIDRIPFSYKNKGSRIINSFLKLFSFSGLKEKNRTKFIKKSILKDNLFDQILIIRPDKLEKEALLFLRKNSIQMTCFLFDGIENFKDQKKTLSHFDTVYSYDKKDVEKYKFKFLTNYIYDDKIESKVITNIAFNISSFDKRFLLLEMLANYLKDNKISFRFIVKKDKFIKHQNIEIANQYVPINEVKEYIASSLVLVDIQKENQYGLSFRIFEALGYKKKLITNNKDIVNYDFYNANNIFVISEENYTIPLDFFKTEYVVIDSKILDKYSLKSWIFEVFKIDSK